MRSVIEYVQILQGAATATESRAERTESYRINQPTESVLVCKMSKREEV